MKQIDEIRKYSYENLHMNLSKEHISQKVYGNLQKDPNRTARAKTLKSNVIYISKILYEKKVHQISNKLIINPTIGTKI